jgi:hypothetical protein
VTASEVVRHITHVEFTGTRFYWWCQHPDCEGSSRFFVYEADCANFAAQHEREAEK